ALIARRARPETAGRRWQRLFSEPTGGSWRCLSVPLRPCLVLPSTAAIPASDGRASVPECVPGGAVPGCGSAGVVACETVPTDLSAPRALAPAAGNGPRRAVH